MTEAVVHFSRRFETLIGPFAPLIGRLNTFIGIASTAAHRGLSGRVLGVRFAA